MFKTEEHILYQYSVDAVYGIEAEVRRNMLFRAIEVLHSMARRGSEPAVALDRAGIMAFRDITFLAAGPASERSRSADR